MDSISEAVVADFTSNRCDFEPFTRRLLCRPIEQVFLCGAFAHLLNRVREPGRKGRLHDSWVYNTGRCRATGCLSASVVQMA